MPCVCRLKPRRNLHGKIEQKRVPTVGAPLVAALGSTKAAPHQPLFSVYLPHSMAMTRLARVLVDRSCGARCWMVQGAGGPGFTLENEHRCSVWLSRGPKNSAAIPSGQSRVLRAIDHPHRATANAIKHAISETV